MRSRRSTPTEGRPEDMSAIMQTSLLDLPTVEQPTEVMMEIAKMTAEDDTMVTGRFRYVQRPGDSLPIFDLSLYKDMKPFTKTFEHDQVYTIPLSVAKFLNKGCAEPQHALLLNANGKSIPGVGQFKSRFEFVPVANF